MRALLVWLLGYVIACIPVSVWCQMASAVEYRKVAMTGDIVPDMNGSMTWTLTHVGYPVLNDYGDVAFTANVTNPSGSLQCGSWIQRDQQMSCIQRTGVSPPGYSGTATYGSDAFVILANNRQVGFSEALSGGAYNGREGSWIGSPGSLQRFVGPGMQAPDMPGAIVYSAYKVELSRSGKMAASGLLTDNRHAIWAGDSSQVQVVTYDGAPLPEIGAGAYVGLQNNPLTGINDSGRVSYMVTVNGLSKSLDSLWSATATDRTLIALEGDSAPGTPTAATFSGFLTSKINNLNQVVFEGYFHSGSGSSSGIWVAQPGAASPTPIAVSGTAAPIPNAIFDGIYQTGIVNFDNLGRVGFTAGLSGSGIDATNNQTAWVGDTSHLELLARGGDQAPGLPSGVLFASSASYVTFATPSLADDGSVYVRARLAGQGVNSTNNDAIFYKGQDGPLSLLLREGQTLHVSPNDDRTIASFEYYLLSLGDNTGYNNRGQLAVDLEFTDGSSGIFVFSVPEPTSIALCLSGLVILGLHTIHRCRRGGKEDRK